MTTDSETTEQYLNFVWTRFLISVLVFVSRDYELGTKFSWHLDFGGVDRQSCTGLIFFVFYNSTKKTEPTVFSQPNLKYPHIPNNGTVSVKNFSCWLLRFERENFAKITERQFVWNHV